MSNHTNYSHIMSSPVVPEDFRASIPAVNGNFCQKFLASFSLGKLMASWSAYFMNEDGSPGPDFVADICALGCVGSGTGTGGGAGIQAPLIFASDGDFSDLVRITWDAVQGATSYDIFRSVTNDSASAVAIKSGELTALYQDSTVVPGNYYYYWVKARTLSGISSFSNGDRGHAGSIPSSLAAIADLDASRGFSTGNAATIKLMWTPVTGAQTYDIYRNTENDFATADLVDSNRAPTSNAGSPSLGNAPYFVDNDGELIYYHKTAVNSNQFATYYFWVLARRSNPDIVSLTSNVGTGWAVGPGAGVEPNSWGTVESNTEHTVPSGVTSIWCALFGAGAGGAGGNTTKSGGAGGGGAIVVGKYTVVAGSKYRVRSNPEADTSNAATGTNGANGPLTFLEYSAAGTWADTVTIAQIGAPVGGTFDGAGGAGSTVVTNNLTSSTSWVGRAGQNRSGTTGGRSGYRFGSVRGQPAHYNNFTSGSSFSGDGQSGWGAGSGSMASPSSAALATGGKGIRGFAVVSEIIQ